MKRVAVIGGGPAGAFAAENLARAGLHTVLVDEKLAWEKPCGGGLTYKAYQRYPFLIENSHPKKIVSEMCIAAPKAGAVKMGLEPAAGDILPFRSEPHAVGASRASGSPTGENASARNQPQRRRMAGQNAARTLSRRTIASSPRADEIRFATSERNGRAGDTMYALGYYAPYQQDHVDIQFLPNLQGYIWVFPRCGHVSVGIGAKGESAQSLRARLERYMDEKGIPYRGAPFFAHMLPSLESSRWKTNRVAGEGWFAVGDAGGLVDPITGEGLYYAMRSAELASQVLLNESLSPAEKAQVYASLLYRDFAEDLEFGASLAQRLFVGKFLFGTIPARTVQFIRRSPRFRTLVGDLVAGTQPYLDLKSRLLKNLQALSGRWSQTASSHEPIPIPSRIPPRSEADPGRCQLTGSGVSQRRRDSAVHRPR